MGVFSPSGPAAPSTVSVLGSSNPSIAVISIPLANTEQSFALTAQTKQFSLKLRGVATLKVAFIAGDSGTTYLEIAAGELREFKDLSLGSGFLIYFQSSRASQILEIESWT